MAVKTYLIRNSELDVKKTRFCPFRESSLVAWPLREFVGLYLPPHNFTGLITLLPEILQTTSQNALSQYHGLKIQNLTSRVTPGAKISRSHTLSSQNVPTSCRWGHTTETLLVKYGLKNGLKSLLNAVYVFMSWTAFWVNKVQIIADYFTWNNSDMTKCHLKRIRCALFEFSYGHLNVNYLCDQEALVMQYCKWHNFGSHNLELKDYQKDLEK